MRTIDKIPQPELIEAIEAGKRVWCNDCQEFAELRYSRSYGGDVCDNCAGDDYCSEIQEFLTGHFLCERCETVFEAEYITDHGNGNYHCQGCRCRRC